MKLIAKKATPAAIAVLRQATAIKPTRNKLSDGLLPSAAHLKPGFLASSQARLLLQLCVVAQMKGDAVVDREIRAFQPALALH